jgi:hypothetical protein
MSDGNPFTLLFDDVVAEMGLVAGAVYGVIWRYCQQRRRVCYASQQTLAGHLGLSRQTLNKHIGALVHAGYIEDITPQSEGQAHVYRLTAKREGGAVSISAGPDAGEPANSAETPVNIFDNPVGEPVKNIDSPADGPVNEIDSTCQATRQPPVKDFDTSNTILQDKETRIIFVGQVFSRLTGLAPPGGSYEVWRHPLLRLLALGGGDLGATERLVGEAVRRLLAGGYLLRSPRSILTTVENLVGRAQGLRPARDEESEDERERRAIAENERALEVWRRAREGG